MSTPPAGSAPSTPIPGGPGVPAPGAPVINPEGRRRLGAALASRFKQYESDRRIAELKWERNARQVLGIYDPETEKDIDINRSRAYPKLTRWKVVSMLSRLMNLLFQADDKCWTVNASPVPDLDEEDLQQVLDALVPPAPPGNDLQDASAMPAPPQQAPSDEVVEAAILAFAKKRAARMELEIEDQLQDLGGSRMLDFVSLCRKVLMSGIQYGAGILKGPFIEERTMRRWQMSGQGRLTAVPYTGYRPRFEFCPLWTYYPDMAAKERNQMDGQFERVVMNHHQVSMLKQRPDFMADQIEAFLKSWPQGNYVRKAYETELRAMGVAINVTQSERRKFEAIVWEGFVNGRELADCGVDVPDNKLNDDVRACVWIMDNYVIKAELDPWSTLDTDGEMPRYHTFIFEDDETFLLGNSLPQIVRDSQLGLCAATRMALDNGAVQRIFEVNTALMRLDQDITAINPDMILYRDDDNPATAQYPAIRPIEIPVHLDSLAMLAKMFENFADQETFVGAATGGDMQKGPSEPFRTATGASMLRGDAALPFKDVVRNFDIFTESVISSLLVFNRNFNPNTGIRGDFKAVARGATSLIAKEVRGIQLDNLAQTLTDEEKKYVDFRELVRERVRVRDLQAEAIIFDDDRCDQIDQQTQQDQQQQQGQQQQMLQAQIREMLAAALKDLSQAGKNTAAAEATTANVILDALEKGLNPDMVSPHIMESANGTGGAATAGGGGQGAAAGGAGTAGGGGAAAGGQAGPGVAGPVVAPAALAAATQPGGSYAQAMPAG